jgi:SNF2 family DNA or RNA helicase
MKYVPHPYQIRAKDFLLDNPNAALFLDMGLGKSVIALTAVAELQDCLEVDKALVIAPKSVARNTWSAEAQKWDHVSHLRLSIILGDEKTRERALASDADIYVINRENVVWLVERYKEWPWPFDMVIIDESSSFKNPSAKRFKALRRVRPQFRRVILLTGTPSPNGLMDLWSQIWLLDMGQRLGKTLTSYRAKYFTPGRRNGAVIYEWRPKVGTTTKISELISDICMSMRAEDYIEVPDMIEAGMTLNFTEEKALLYKDFEREQLLQIDEDTIEALTAAALTNKLLQFTSGAVYDNEHKWHFVDETKIEALADIIENANEPVLVYYNYIHEKERIMDALKQYRPVAFRGEPGILQKWNEQKIRVMIAHPRSVAYGLNMQQGGRIIVWHSLTWDLEIYEQANKRLHRQGQTKPVLLYHLIVRGTMDERVMRTLKGKGDTQVSLLQQIREMKKLL